MLFDVSTLYFETDTGDGFREPGFSKERRLEPQITLGLLTDAAGFPLTVQAFEGNKAETATMLPVINAFKAAHHLTDVTVVADAGMISEANQIALQAAGLSFILGTRIPQLPDLVRRWRDTHSEQAIPDGLTLTQPWPSTSSEKARGIPDRVIHYQYRHDRARRTLRGIDEQVRKAERAVDGHAPVKRNRYIQLSGATKTVNRALETKTRALAGWKGYTTNLVDQSATFVIDAYHQLWHIEKAFRMSKHDLQARPVSCRRRHVTGYADVWIMPMVKVSVVVSGGQQRGTGGGVGIAFGVRLLLSREEACGGARWRGFLRTAADVDGSLGIMVAADGVLRRAGASGEERFRQAVVVDGGLWSDGYGSERRRDRRTHPCRATAVGSTVTGRGAVSAAG